MATPGTSIAAAGGAVADVGTTFAQSAEAACGALWEISDSIFGPKIPPNDIGAVPLSLLIGGRVNVMFFFT